MNCVRCGSCGAMTDVLPDSYGEHDGGSSVNEDCHSDQEDIGGFAGITGCLHKLKSSEKQVSKVDMWKPFFTPEFVLFFCHL